MRCFFHRLLFIICFSAIAADVRSQMNDSDSNPFIDKPSEKFVGLFKISEGDSLYCPCFSEKMLDSLFHFSWKSGWWSDVPGCKIKPHHEMLEFVIRQAGAPDYNFNFSAQAGMVDGKPFIGSDYFNNITGVYEWRCGGPCGEPLAKPCAIILKRFIEKVKSQRPLMNYCGVSGSPGSKKIAAHIPPPVWRDIRYILLVSLLFIGIISLASIIYLRRKLENKNIQLSEQRAIIEQQKMIAEERTRIAAELHDDLGAGLTNILYLSSKEKEEQKDNENLKRISSVSNDLISNMSEIIWAFNSRFDIIDDLISFLRRYASEYFDDNKIEVEFLIPENNLKNASISGEKRRHLFFVFKETLHNVVKHSGTHKVSIEFSILDHRMLIRISEENGKGFDAREMQNKGNGINNLRKRMSVLNGNISFVNNGHGMDVIIEFPI